MCIYNNIHHLPHDTWRHIAAANMFYAATRHAWLHVAILMRPRASYEYAAAYNSVINSNDFGSLLILNTTLFVYLQLYNSVIDDNDFSSHLILNTSLFIYLSGLLLRKLMCLPSVWYAYFKPAINGQSPVVCSQDINSKDIVLTPGSLTSIMQCTII